MNKTRILLIMCLGLVMLGSIPAVFGAPTILDMTWDGSGYVDVDFNSSDDAVMNFYTAGNHILGTLYAEDTDYDYYSYGVNNFLTYVDARVENGGEILYGVERTDSLVSMYGIADQSTFSGISVGTGGWASLRFRTTTNYANLGSHNYGYMGSNNQFTAGGVYSAQHDVVNGDNNAWFSAVGDGELYIDHMNDDTGNTGITFGAGGGCYTNANVDQTGAGTFNIGATFGNSFSTDGITISGAGTYNTGVTFSSGFSWADYSLSLN